MKIKEITSPEDKTRYNEIAKKSGTIFNTLEWLDIFKNKIRLFGIYEGDKNLIGGFCLYKERQFGLRIYRNPFFTPSIGPFLNIKAENPVSIMNRWKKATKLMAKTLDNIPHSIISVSLNRNVIDTQPFIWRKFKVNPRYTYILNMERSLEESYQRMSGPRRRNIKKAVNSGLITKQNVNPQIIKSLVLNTLARQKKNIKEDYLNKILFEFTTPENSLSFTIFKKEKAIATVFCIYHKNTAYYILGGYNREAEHHGAVTLAMWEAIKHAKGSNLKYFDFEGSIVPQIEKYFRGFGGELTPYYRISKAKLPLEIVLKFFKREIF